MNMRIDIPINDLHEGIQLRIGINKDTVTKYAEIMKESGWGEFPPLDVCQVDNRWRIADGHHRWLAAKEAGIDMIPCHHVGETDGELILYAAHGNSKHGLQFTKDERHNAVLTVLREFPLKSQREVAKICGVSKSTVLKIQQEGFNDEVLERPEKVIGTDGRTYNNPVKTTGRKDQSPSSVSTTPVKTSTSTTIPHVTCSNCGLKVPRELTEVSDSTWEKREYNPDTGQYEHWFCCYDCLDEWQCNQNDKKADKILEDKGLNSLKDLRPTPSARVATKPNPSLQPVCPVEKVHTLNVSFRISFRDIEIMAPTEADAINVLVNRLKACGVNADVEVEEINDSKDGNDQLVETTPEETIQEKNNKQNLSGEQTNFTETEIEQTSIKRKQATKRGVNLPEDEKTEFIFPIIGDEEFMLSKTELAHFETYYPGIDVKETLRSCIAWNFSNPKNRKTRSGIMRHINNWLSTHQNQARKTNYKAGNNAQQQVLKSPYANAHISFENVEY